MSLGRKFKDWTVQNGRENAVKQINELVSTDPGVRNRVSIRDMAESFCGGPEWERNLREYQQNPFAFMHGRENAADAVDPSTFAQITGNLLIDTIRDKYKSPEFIGEQLCTTIPVNNGNLDSQKEPWLSDVQATKRLEDAGESDDDEDVVQPGMPFNKAGFTPNYVLLGKPQKRQRGADVTFEMIYADRTRQAHESAGSVGKRLGRNKEYRILKVFLGMRNNYTYSFNGAAEATSNTYIETNPGTKWVNHIDSLPLISWTDINAVEQLFAQMRDPATGQPIDIEANMMFVMPSKWHTAQHILHATQTRMGPGGSTSTAAPESAGPVLTYAGSTIRQYQLMTSKYAYKLAALNGTLTQQDGTSAATITAAQANDLWLMGNPKQAFYYREVYPLRVINAPTMNPEEYNRDIVLSVKASEYGYAGVRDPRQMVRVMGHNFNTATG